MPRSILAAFLLAVLALGTPGTAIGAAPTCFGKPATHVMHAGDGPYTGTDGDDVVVGSPGNDLIDLFASLGNDLACGGEGDDGIHILTGGSKADGGPGQDQVFASNSGQVWGGSGNDIVEVAGSFGGLADGGSGNDFVYAVVGATGKGGSGNDLVEGLDAGFLSGDSGSDKLQNDSGTPRIDCGSAYDLVFANGATDVHRCEGTFTPNG